MEGPSKNRILDFEFLLFFYTAYWTPPPQKKKKTIKKQQQQQQSDKAGDGFAYFVCFCFLDKIPCSDQAILYVRR